MTAGPAAGGAAATNGGRLIGTTLTGRVAPVRLLGDPYLVDRDGTPFVGVGIGGIAPAVRVGMPALGWAGEQVEPAVSIVHPDPAANADLSLQACVGNRVEIQGGAVDGAIGVVTGKHEEFQAFTHVLCDFPPEVSERLGPEDRVVVRAVGVGLAVRDAPSVACHRLSPRLWAAWAPRVTGGRLQVGVVAVCPPHLVGMGAGRLAATTSLEIQTSSPSALTAAGLDHLRLGDLVAVRDWDGRFAIGYRPGALTVGVIATGASRRAGRGLAVTVLVSALDGRLEVQVHPGANLAALLAVGEAGP